MTRFAPDSFYCITRRNIFVNHVKTKTKSLKPRLRKQNKYCQEARSKTTTLHLNLKSERCR